MDKFDSIEVCTHYEDEEGNTYKILPLSINKVEKLKPVYQKFPGWLVNTQGIQDFKQLPKEAKKYFKFLEKELGVEIGIISTGPERTQTLLK